jgi:hypothetical protein
MPRVMWHEKPCGAMWRFKEYRFEDLVPVSMMYKLAKEDLHKLCDPYSTGRKRRLTAQRAYSRLIRLFWSKAIDRMMQSDRLLVDNDITMYIGKVDKDKNLIYDKTHKKSYLRMANTHGVILNGFFHNYYFRMPARRRRELRKRLKNGQSFIA